MSTCVDVRCLPACIPQASQKNVFGLHGGLYSLCNAMRWVFLVFSHVAAWWPQTECRRFTTPYRHVYQLYTDDMPPHTDRTPSVHRLNIHHARRPSENKVYKIFVYVIFFSCRMPRKKKTMLGIVLGGRGISSNDWAAPGVPKNRLSQAKVPFLDY